MPKIREVCPSCGGNLDITTSFEFGELWTHCVCPCGWEWEGIRQEEVSVPFVTPTHIMSDAEIHSMQVGQSTWIEYRWVNQQGETKTHMEIAVVTPDLDLATEGGYTYLPHVHSVSTDKYRERYWSAKPTEEERKNW